MKKKRAVIFDVGGVLIAPPQRAIAAHERELGLPKGTITYVFAHGAPHNAFCRMERGELTLSQYHAWRMLKAIHAKVGLQKLVEIPGKKFFPEFEKECQEVAHSRGLTIPWGFSARELFQKMAATLEPIPEMIAAVKTLRTAGFKTCALTNNWIDDTWSRGDQFEGFPVDHFDLVLESCKLGIRKPDPQIYQLACEQLQVDPDEVVFLDDIGTNLKSAKRLGITTIHVRNPGKALRELERVLRVSLVPSDMQGQRISDHRQVLKSKL